jgi:hypothetical protein
MSRSALAILDTTLPPVQCTKALVGEAALNVRFPSKGTQYFRRHVVPLLQKPLHDPICDPAQPLHAVAPRVTEKRDTEARVETLTNSSSLPELLKRALERRLNGTGLTDAILARELKVSRQTVWTWLNGINQPKGHHLVALINFFDSAFANEILGPTAGLTVAKLCDRRAAALLKVAEGLAELKAIGGDR